MPMLNAEDAALVANLDAAALRFDARGATGTTGTAQSKAAVCRDIAARVRRAGGFASIRQRSYAEALVRWSVSGEEGSNVAQERSARRSVLMNVTTLARIAELMSVALVNGLHFPKIRLQRGEWKIRIYPAPRHGRHPGSYYVKANRIYCGLIEGTNTNPGQPQGTFVPSADCPLDVIEALREFNTDPTRVATESVSLRPHQEAVQRMLAQIPEHQRTVIGNARQPGRTTAAQRLRAAHDRELEERRRLQADREQGRSVAEAQRPTMPRPAPVQTPVDPDDEDSHFM